MLDGFLTVQTALTNCKLFRKHLYALQSAVHLTLLLPKERKLAFHYLLSLVHYLLDF